MTARHSTASELAVLVLEYDCFKPLMLIVELVIRDMRDSPRFDLGMLYPEK